LLFLGQIVNFVFANFVFAKTALGENVPVDRGARDEVLNRKAFSQKADLSFVKPSSFIQLANARSGNQLSGEASFAHLRFLLLRDTAAVVLHRPAQRRNASPRIANQPQDIGGINFAPKRSGKVKIASVLGEKGLTIIDAEVARDCN